MFSAYIFQCEANDRFDIGVTDDLKQAYADHIRMLEETPGLKPPKVRIYDERFATRAEAEERTTWMKRWDRASMIQALDK